MFTIVSSLQFKLLLKKTLYKNQMFFNDSGQSGIIITIQVKFLIKREKTLTVIAPKL